MFKKYANVIRILFSLGLLGVVFFGLKDNLAGVKEVFLTANIYFILLSLAVYVLCTFFMAMRFKAVLSGQDVHLSLREAWELYWVGYFFNIFLPSSVGGDIAKAYYAGHKTKKKMQSYTSVFLDRFFGMVGIMVVAGISVLCYGDRFPQKKIITIVAAIIVGSLLGVCVVLNRTIASWAKSLIKRIGIIHFPFVDQIKKVYALVHTYQARRKVVWYSILISIVNQMLFAVAVFFLGLSLSCTVDLTKYLVIVPIVGAVTTLPSINGIGVREGAFVLFFQGLMLKEQAIAISVIWSCLAMVMSLLGGIVYITHPQYRIKESAQEAVQ